MCSRILPQAAALVLGAALIAVPAFADGLKDEIAPTKPKTAKPSRKRRTT